jgi:hypothetical protein
MELLSPENFMMIWLSLYLVIILLVLVSWTLILTAKNITPTTKLIWFLGTLYLPVIGPILLFFSLTTLKRTV